MRSVISCFLGRHKIIAVTHPFTRLARVYLETVKDSPDPKLAKAVGGKRVSFADFVRFLTRGEEFGEDLVADEELNAPWAPYHKDCPICHHGK